MPGGQDQSRRDEAIDSPTAWFAVLERARRTEDYELAARAKRELDRLGVSVKFHRRDSKRGERLGATAPAKKEPTS